MRLESNNISIEGMCSPAFRRERYLVPVALGFGDNVERRIMGGTRVVSLVVFASDMTSDKAASVGDLFGQSSPRVSKLSGPSSGGELRPPSHRIPRGGGHPVMHGQASPEALVPSRSN
jgi:hypothetical protein